MRVAELLSDLTSLRSGVCDSKAALALVSARSSESTTLPEDSEIQRVKDLIELHAKAKAAQGSGIDANLRRARESIAALSQ